nr:bifunctional adenosylcobinamide kinase/adenosylcobinamide-phosphate guanylyltransferase [Tranquillimonas alkanivorans]
MLPKVTFVLGGASSGKSDFAEKCVGLADGKRVYLATAQAFDDEMEAKIAAHRTARGPHWRTVEAPLDLVTPLEALAADEIALLDCLTLWLSNHLLTNSDIEAETQRLLAAIDSVRCPLVVVSNEVGAGVVPDNALARRFRTAQGRLNRLVAGRADSVVTVMAGLPLALKGPLPPVPA